MEYVGYSWQGKQYKRVHDSRYDAWVETAPPEPGDSVHLGWDGMKLVVYPSDGEVTHYEIPCTLWGDYCGDVMYRSNYRSLLRDYPETFVEVTSGFDGHHLVIAVELMTEDLDHIFSRLAEQYPIYDESDSGELEMDLAWEAWGQYLRFDVVHDLDKAGVDTEAIDDDELRERYYTLTGEQCEFPHGESNCGTSVIFPCHDSVMEALTEHYGVTES